jgi:hypothetical protein
VLAVHDRLLCDSITALGGPVVLSLSLATARVCVRACVRVCVRACVRACVCDGTRRCRSCWRTGWAQGR